MQSPMLLSDISHYTVVARASASAGSSGVASRQAAGGRASFATRAATIVRNLMAAPARGAHAQGAFEL